MCQCTTTKPFACCKHTHSIFCCGVRAHTPHTFGMLMWFVCLTYSMYTPHNIVFNLSPHLFWFRHIARPFLSLSLTSRGVPDELSRVPAWQVCLGRLWGFVIRFLEHVASLPFLRVWIGLVRVGTSSHCRLGSKVWYAQCKTLWLNQNLEGRAGRPWLLYCVQVGLAILADVRGTCVA